MITCSNKTKTVYSSSVFLVLEEGKPLISLPNFFFLLWSFTTNCVWLSGQLRLFNYFYCYLLTCSCHCIAPVLLSFALTIYLYFRELIHLLIHLSEALHEAQLKLILVIPPAVAAGWVFLFRWQVPDEKYFLVWYTTNSKLCLQLCSLNG